MACALPPPIAPFAVVVTPVNYADAEQRQAAENIYQALLRFRDLDALIDDRDERPGVKFKDADLIGMPFRVTVGKKLAQGFVEVVTRRTRESVDVAVDDVANHVREKLNQPHECGLGRSTRNEFPAMSKWTYLNTATFGQVAAQRQPQRVAAHFARSR